MPTIAELDTQISAVQSEAHGLEAELAELEQQIAAAWDDDTTLLAQRHAQITARLRAAPVRLEQLGELRRTAAVEQAYADGRAILERLLSVEADHLAAKQRVSDLEARLQVARAEARDLNEKEAHLRGEVSGHLDYMQRQLRIDSDVARREFSMMQAVMMREREAKAAEGSQEKIPADVH